MLESIEKSPCPFCNGEVGVVEMITKCDGAKFFKISCNNCFCPGANIHMWYKTEIEAIAAWNSRAGVRHEGNESVEYKREFVGLEVSMVPCSYINGGKAPYYSIVYRENGQLLQGYSSFDIGTVSEYLRDYFIGQGRDASDKPGTVKELLKRMVDEVYNDSHGVPFDRDFIVEKYANELYELQRQA